MRSGIYLNRATVNAPILFLYLLFFVHLFSYKFPALAGAYVPLTLFFLLLTKNITLNYVELLAVAVLIITFVISTLLGFASRETAFFVWFILLYFYFKHNHFTKKQFLNYLNITYLIYVVLSCLVSFKYIQPGFMPAGTPLNQFTVDLGFVQWNTLIGYSGTTASIDAYSVIIFLVNYLQKGSRLVIAFAIINVLLAARFTPLAIILIAPIVVLFRKKPLILLAFIVLVSISFAIPYLTSFNSFSDSIYFAITSGRSFIWGNYMELMRNFDISTILFGYRSNNFPEVIASVNIGYIESAHSSYLRILISNGLIIYFLFIGFIYHRLLKSRYNKSNIFLVVAIIIAAITNENIFYNHHPVYLLIFLYYSDHANIN